MQSPITSWLKKSSVKPEVALPHTNEAEQAETTSMKPPTPAIISGEMNKQGNLKESQDLRNHKFASPKPLPSEASIQPITKATLPEFKRLIQLLLPIPYSDKFFKEILSDEVTASISLAAHWKSNTDAKEIIVAGIRCRLLASSPSSSTSSSQDTRSILYIATIGTLAPYRRHGLAAALLRSVMQTAISDYGIGRVSAHVWEANEEAREWYAKMGFRQVVYEMGYYRRLSPDGAYLVEREVRPSDMLGDDGRVVKT